MEEIIEKKEKKGKKKGKKIIRIISAVLVTVLIVAFFAIVRPFSWKYDFKTRELTVTGTGAFHNMFIIDVIRPAHVVIEDGIRIIPGGAFYRCDSIKSIDIPDSVTSIDDCAFYLCESLTSITIPDSVTSIDGHAFAHCTNLTNITMSDSVTSIGIGAFSYCIGLTSVTIPDSVTSIGDQAFFQSCENLTDIYFEGSEAQWNKITDDILVCEYNVTVHFGK